MWPRGVMLWLTLIWRSVAGQMVVDAHGRLVPVQEHLTATALAPVIRKGIPTDWPRPTPVPSHEDAGVPDVRPPELEREAQIAPLRSEPFEKPAEVKRSWLSRHGTDLLIVTSGAFLVPAQRAGRHGLNWFSVIFASQAVICGIYHYCDQHRVGTELNGPVCSDQSYRFWHLADHGMAYFVMLQMGFLLLGPEDPILRRFSPWTSVEHPPFAGNAGECHEPDATGSEQGILGQWQTVSATRLCPGFLMFLVIWRAARGEHVIGSPAFHVVLGTLCCLLFLFAQSAFWLLRRSVATQALQMKQAWFRALLCICSVIIATMMFVAMQLVANDGTKVGMGGAKAFAHSAWHALRPFGLIWSASRDTTSSKR
ncbi:unnamed protein product [Cladocopium goreaui]|uniref:Ceramidase n=1 Tax=Cladocopium goreaui TaxID=2562237 RepID=A0A9P1GQD2_9DINO|nr:unnamed protein product [Cladocopium goreaui]